MGRAVTYRSDAECEHDPPPNLLMAFIRTPLRDDEGDCDQLFEAILVQKITVDAPSRGEDVSKQRISRCEQTCPRLSLGRERLQSLSGLRQLLVLAGGPLGLPP